MYHANAVSPPHYQTELICCDGCSNAYHTNCLGKTPDFLPDPWHCPSCATESVNTDVIPVATDVLLAKLGDHHVKVTIKIGQHHDEDTTTSRKKKREEEEDEEEEEEENDIDQLQDTDSEEEESDFEPEEEESDEDVNITSTDLDIDVSRMSEYEVKRLLRIRRNEAKLASLGLLGGIPSAAFSSSPGGQS